MKQFLKTSIFLLLAILLPAIATAYDFEVDGIYYNITSDNTVEVTYSFIDYHSVYFEKEIVIPEQVAYNSVNYNVTAIGDSAFYCAHQLKLTIPESVNDIGVDAFKDAMPATITCLSETPPTINNSFASGRECFPYFYFFDEEESASFSGYFYSYSEHDNFIVLLVPSSGYESYKELNDIHHFFNWIYCYDWEKTEAPSSTIDMNYYVQSEEPGWYYPRIKITFTPNEESAVISRVNTHPANIMYIGHWIEEDSVRWLDYYDVYHLFICEVEVYAVAEGKLPSDLIEGSGGGHRPPIKGYDFEDSGIAYSYAGDSSVIVSRGCYIDDYDYHYFNYSGDIVIPSQVNGYKVIGIDEEAFKECYDLTSITIPNSITFIEWDAFSDCSSMTSVHITDLESWCKISFGGSVTSNPLYYAHHLFLNGVEVKNLVIPSTITFVGDCAFSGCSGLTSVIIPNSVTSIGYYAFGECSGLTSVIIPNSVPSIDGWAFYGCSNLSSVTLPVSIRMIDECGYSSTMSFVFENSPIESVYFTGEGEWQAGELPDSVKTLLIGNGVTGVKGMQVNPETIYCYATTPPVCDENSFTGYDAELHVPASSLAAYFTAPYWCNFTNIIGDAVPLTNISLNNDSIEVLKGDQVTIRASLNPANAMPNTVTWSSSDESVAKVENGVVTALSAGECDITASCQDKRVVCHVTVVEQYIYISLDQHEASVLPNHIIMLTPTVSPASTDLVVTSSNPAVAAARLAGNRIQVVGVSEGEATIVVNSADGYAFADSCQVKVYTERGDVNGDGFVDIADVSALIDYLLGGDASEVNAVNADTDANGGVSIADVSMLIDYLLGSTELPPKEEDGMVEYTVNGVTFKMVKVDGGSFTMGATEEEDADYQVFKGSPKHQVTLSKYWIGQTEVTQELWAAVMGSNPSSDQTNLQYPVNSISWEDCATFISQLNQLTGKQFRLPTEAEWEYAAKGGAKSMGYVYSGSDNLDEVAWFSTNSESHLHQVGTKKANELGLYDMCGNIDEWCNDWYSLYTADPVENPTGPETGMSRIHRGGRWNASAMYCRLTRRDGFAPGVTRNYLGLRLALTE